MPNDITAPTMPKRPPTPQRRLDPRVEGFLSEYTSLVDDRERLSTNLSDREREIEQLQDRVDLLSHELVAVRAERDRELATVRAERDSYQRGYRTLETKLELLVAAAVAACKGVIDTANATLDGAENEVNGNSRKPPPEPAPEPKLPPVADLEAEIAKLASTEP